MTLAAASPANAPARHLHIAIAGNPNSGKSTLFNALTGLRQHVANYPGVTVEKREGVLAGSDIVLLDLPGCYSLTVRSPDEAIARGVLLGEIEGTARPNAVVVVVDASNLERNLYLATQVMNLGIPLMVACNMMDVAEHRGLRVDCGALSKMLGVPVIPTIATRKESLGALKRALAEVNGREPATGSQHGFEGRPAAASGTASAVVAGADIEARYARIKQIVEAAVRQADSHEGAGRARRDLTERLDAYLTHRVFGLVFFTAVMLALFLSIFSLADPLMGAIESAMVFVAGSLGSVLSEGALKSLLCDGVIGGVGAVLVFFPQICLLFLFIAILEDSGYMARAAFMSDRLMRAFGLSGKSFLPLFSCYACAVPGIMATRTIENRRERLVTILVAPLMSCSARLPVYIIIIAAVFGERTWLKAGVMFGMYALGTITAMCLAWLFKRTATKGISLPLLMEMPPYHLPRPWPVIRTMWDRSKSFLTGAGTTIFLVCLAVWALSYYPRTAPATFPAEVQERIAQIHETNVDQREQVIAAEQLRQSYIGRMGRAIEPAIAPLGFDWRIGIGILTSFLAREVFVGTMGITFAVGEADQESVALREQLAGATWPDGRTLLTPLTGIGLMVFYVLACQCVSTLAVVRKETSSRRWPAFMFAYMSVLAYLASLAVYQIGTRLGL